MVVKELGWVVYKLALHVNYLRIAVRRRRWRELPVQDGLPRRDGAQASLGNPEVVAASYIRAVAESNGTEYERTGVGYPVSEVTGIWTVTYLVLQYGLKIVIVLGDRAGQSAAIAYLIYPGVLQKRIGESQIALLGEGIIMRIALHPQAKHESVTYVGGPAIGRRGAFGKEQQCRVPQRPSGVRVAVGVRVFVGVRVAPPGVGVGCVYTPHKGRQIVGPGFRPC